MTTQDPDQQGAVTSEASGAAGADDAAPAAAEPATATETPATETPAEETPAGETPATGGGSGRRTAVIASTLALVLACFAAAAAGFLWWQYRQFYVVLDRADGDTQAALRTVRADVRGLEDRIADVAAEEDAVGRALQQVVERVDTFPPRLAELDERIAAAQGVSMDARRRWLRARAEYYLGVANTELTLRDNRGNAITALELADEALLDAGDPAFAPVRERIAGELLELRGMRTPDVEGLSYSLSRLAARVGELPMRAPAADETAARRSAEEAEPGLGRLWQSVKNALGSMFSIERRATPAVYTLSRGQQIMVRRQLELELTLARLGLVQAMPELYSGSLETARTLLERHFDTDQAPVEGAQALLDEMLELEIAPSYPDISGSLALLRDLSDRVD